MAELIRSSRRRKVSCRPDSAAAASNSQRPPMAPEPASETTQAADSGPQANLDNSAQFRANMRRRYEVPFGW